MKKRFFLFMLGASCLLIVLACGCKKNNSSNAGPTGISTSFTEEFDSIFKLANKGWVFPANGSGGNWGQGYHGVDKSGIWHGFNAYSYSITPDEFAYAGNSSLLTTNYTISCWLITPVLAVKNGDKISFYGRADTVGNNTDRLQVRMSNSSSSDAGNSASNAGDFVTILLDINSSQATGGFPVNWTKYEYIFSGISGKTDTRIGFRYYVNNATTGRGIGIDQFKFESQ